MRKFLRARVNHPPFSIYALTFFTTLHYAFTVYINSSFLKQFISEEKVGVIYTIAAIASAILLSQMPRLIEKFGLRRLTSFILLSDTLTLLGLALVGMAHKA